MDAANDHRGWQEDPRARRVVTRARRRRVLSGSGRTAPEPLFLHLAFGALLLAASCADGSPRHGIAPVPRSTRLERQIAELDDRIALVKERSAFPAILDSLESLSTQLGPDQRSLDLGETTVLTLEIGFHLRWNREGHAQGVGAMDLDHERHPFHAVLSYNRQLAARGIDLVFVPIPVRFEVYPEWLPGIDASDPYAGASPLGSQLLLELTRAGVEIIDLLPHFASAKEDDEAAGEALYFRHDSHWTPRALEIAASVIADHLQTLASFEPGAAKEGTDFIVRSEAGPWPIQATDGVRRENATFRRVLRPDGSKLDGSDRESPLLLLGDSFSVGFRHLSSDLPRHLYAKLGRLADTIGLSAGGAVQVWQNVARRKDDLRGKKIVVWILTTRALGSRRFREVEVFSE